MERPTLLISCPWDKLSNAYKLKEKRFVWLMISIDSFPGQLAVASNKMAEEHGGGKLLIPGSKVKEETWAHNTPLQFMSPVMDSNLAPPPKSTIS